MPGSCRQLLPARGGHALASAALSRAGPSLFQAQGRDEQVRPAGWRRPLCAAAAAMQPEAGPCSPMLTGAASGSACSGPPVPRASWPTQRALFGRPCTGRPAGREGSRAGPDRWCCCCGRTLQRCWWTRGACRPAGTPLAATRRAPARVGRWAPRSLTLVLLLCLCLAPVRVRAWCRVTVCLLWASPACWQARRSFPAPPRARGALARAP